MLTLFKTARLLNNLIVGVPINIKQKANLVRFATLDLEVKIIRH